MKMRSLLFQSAFLLAGLVVPALCPAAILLSDTFPTDGSPPAGYTLASGTGGQAVVNGQLVISASGTGVGTGDYSKNLSSVLTSGTVYAGFDLVITSAPTDALDNYFAHFALANGANPFTTRVSLNLVGGNTVLGLAESTSTNSVANVFDTTPLALNTTYRIVMSFSYDTGESRVWLNPTTESSTFLADASFATNPASIGAFNFRINNTSDGNKTIDNFVVATTFDEALATTPVPEPSSIALGSLIGIGLISYGVGRRFKR